MCGVRDLIGSYNEMELNFSIKFLNNVKSGVNFLTPKGYSGIKGIRTSRSATK